MAAANGAAGGQDGRIDGRTAAAQARDGHDPFEVDSKQAIEALRPEWGAEYQIWAGDDGYHALRRPAGSALHGATPDDLQRELRRDWGEE